MGLQVREFSPLNIFFPQQNFKSWKTFLSPDISGGSAEAAFSEL